MPIKMTLTMPIDMNEVMPYIFYILSDAEYKTHKNHKIKKIIIKFCDKDEMFLDCLKELLIFSGTSFG